MLVVGLSQQICLYGDFKSREDCSVLTNGAGSAAVFHKRVEDTSETMNLIGRQMAESEVRWYAAQHTSEAAVLPCMIARYRRA